jgi:hypothetical protein
MEVPSLTGDIIPEYVVSFKAYREQVIDRYSKELAARGAERLLLGKDWVNSRGTIFRFDRKALEIRIMDEQECIKSDVALSCFIRALLRGLMNRDTELLSHDVLTGDFNVAVSEGLEAQVRNPLGQTVRRVLMSYMRTAVKNATEEENKYLPIVQKRLADGSLSEIIRKKVKAKSQKTELREVIVDVYLKLAKSLIDNKPYF